ncbi:amino acid ABC transporter permease [Microbacter sp. GSS18]|nr:amino acid ABC transporter permease [Microbacter sp. GSS18]
MTASALPQTDASLVLKPPKLNVVPVRHYGRGVFAVVVGILVFLAIRGLAENPNLEWSIVGEYVFSPAILEGLQSTLLITIVSMVLILIVAIVIAVMRLSKSWVLSGFAAAYSFFFRAVPMIVLLIFVGNLGLFFQNFEFTIPFTEITVFSIPVRDVMTPFWASVIGLTLAGSGYVSELIRAGIISVSNGQWEASSSLGMSRGQTLRLIVLPQAMKVLIPPMGNEFIGLIKAVALVSVIGGGDILTVANAIGANTFRPLEMLMVVAIWYLIVVAVLSVGQHFLERRINKER